MTRLVPNHALLCAKSCYFNHQLTYTLAGKKKAPVPTAPDLSRAPAHVRVPARVILDLLITNPSFDRREKVGLVASSGFYENSFGPKPKRVRLRILHELRLQGPKPCNRTAVVCAYRHVRERKKTGTYTHMTMTWKKKELEHKRRAREA